MNYPINTSIYYPTEKPKVSYHHAFTEKSFFDFVIKEYNPHVFCEVGCFVGGSIDYILSVKKDIFVCAIDIWDNDLFLNRLEPQHKNLRRNVQENSLYDAFLANVWKHKEQVLPLKMDSIDGIKKLKQLSINPDLFYIDSSHQYEETKEELNIIDSLFPDSIICGDDYSKSYKGVIRAVDEFVKIKNFNLKIIKNRFFINK